MSIDLNKKFPLGDGKKYYLNEDVNPKYFLNFMCCGQSGHSIIASIIDAHPHALIAEERLYMNKVSRKGWQRERIFNDVMHDSITRLARSKRKRLRYISYKRFDVVGGAYQWQGRYKDKVLLLGDKCGWDNFGLYSLINKDTGEALGITRGLKQYEKNLQIPLRVIHAIRNPFDIIANWYRGGRKYEKYRRDPKGLERLVTRYDDMTRINKLLYYDSDFPVEQILQVKNEILCTNKKDTIREILEFVGLPIYEDHLKESCDRILSSPHRRALEISWPNNIIEKVNKVIERYDFLEGYTLDGAFK